jgi:hypothetical protein
MVYSVDIRNVGRLSRKINCSLSFEIWISLISALLWAIPAYFTTGAFVCVWRRVGLLAYQTHWKPLLLFQHGRDRLIDGDIWKTLRCLINTARIWPCTGHMGGEWCGRVKWGCFGYVPGTHPWLSHECPGYSTGVIRVLGHFDTRLSYGAHPYSTQTRLSYSTQTHYNTLNDSSAQTARTWWGNTAHSADGDFVRNKQTQSGSDNNVYHLHDITTHRTHMIRLSQTL